MLQALSTRPQKFRTLCLKSPGPEAAGSQRLVTSPPPPIQGGLVTDFCGRVLSRTTARVNGDVDALGLESLLQMLGQQERSGWLILRQGGVSRRFIIMDSHIVAFRSGSGATASPRIGWGSMESRDPRHLRIGELLVERNDVRWETMSRTLEIQRGVLSTPLGRRRPLLGELLLARGEVKPAALRDALAEQLRRDVMDLVSRADVTFEFRPGNPKTHDEIVRVPIMNVLMETARRSDHTRAFTAPAAHARSDVRAAIILPSLDETRRMIGVLRRGGVEAAAFRPEAFSVTALYAFRPTAIVADGDRELESVLSMRRQSILARARLVLLMDRPGEERVRGAARMGARTVLLRPWSAQGLVDRLFGPRVVAAAA